MVPKHLHSLFWDTNIDDFDPAAHPRYTIERVLERGEDADVAWLLRTFSADQVKDVLRTDHRLSPRSANFWRLVFNLPAREVAALNR